MLFKLVVYCCFMKLATSSCPSFIEEAVFKGECASSSDYQWFRFSTMKSSLAVSWKEDIQSSIGQANNETATAITSATDHINQEVGKIQSALHTYRREHDQYITQVTAENSTLMASARSYVDQELNEMNQTLANWKDEQEKRFSKMLAGSLDVIAKLCLDMAAIEAQNVELKKSNEEMKAAIEQLNNARIEDLPTSLQSQIETYEYPQGYQNTDISNRSTLVRTVCKMREALGVKLTESCKLSLYPNNILLL